MRHQPGYVEFRRDIQGLRGVAVLLVVLYHAQVPFLSGGYIGVDVFFVISGYLITGLLVRELEATGRIDFFRFYARRARRLLPAAWLVVLIVLAVCGLLYPPLEQGRIFAACRAAAIYLANFWFAREAVDYLGGALATNPMLHMWSLAVEEQFYLVWAPLVGAAAIGTSIAGMRARLAGIMVGLVLISFALCVWMTWRSQPWAFFGMPFRAWEFGLGALAYLACERVANGGFALAGYAGAAGAALVLLGATMLDEASQFPGVLALLPAGGTALVMISIQDPASSALRSFLSSRPLSWLGDLSYSWYLWHWPALVFAKVAFPAGGAVAASVAVLISLLLAAGSYRFVENPVRYGARFAGKDLTIVVLALTVSLLVAAVGTVLLRMTASRDIPVEQQLYAAARADNLRVLTRGCHAEMDDIEARACESGRADSSITVALAGDSHAAHWFPAFRQLAVNHQWRLLSFTKSNCPAVAVEIFSDMKRRRYVECDEWRERVWRRLAEEKVALVVLAHSRHTREEPSLWEAGALHSVRHFAAHGIPVAIIRETPRPGFNVPTCLARMSWMKRDTQIECSYLRDESLARAGPAWEAEKRALSTYDHGRAIDMTAAICAAERCAVKRGDLVFFSDDHHLTTRFSASLAGVLEAQLREWAAQPDSPVRRLF